MQTISVSLSEYSNYNIGANAKYFTIVRNEQDLENASLFAREKQLKPFVIGHATNILFTKNNYNQYLIIKNEIEIFNKINEHEYEIGAGNNISDLAIKFCNMGLGGLEWAGGLPGTFGGAVRGNAGAFGGEIKDNISSVKSYNLNTNKVVVRNFEECNFSYRNSVYKSSAKDEVILSAILKLSKENPEILLSKLHSNMQYRIDKHPMEYPSLGSTFKNVPIELFQPKILQAVKHVMKTDPFPVIPIAYLIDTVGLKGTKVGNMQISTKQPNFIVNLGGGKANDVLALIEIVKEKVNEEFKVKIEPEIQIF